MARFLARGMAAFVLVFTLALSAASSHAQTRRFDVLGVVVDSAGVGLPGATVVALTRVDSVLTKFASTGGNGSFKLLRVPAGDYILQVTFVGFRPHRSNFSVSNSDVDAGTVTMLESIAELDELVVSADHIPFVAKRDTLDYNARAFVTRPNAVVEDLLRRLPGLEVDDDGTITAQGEEVKNVLVEGKEFFGSDPTIATKNLPADAVERVQVYDKQSDQAEFTGIPDGEQERTIDLKLKPGAKHGYFGRVSGGFGGEQDIENRYDGEASINRFSPTTQLAVIANINNVNRPGFAWGDFLNFMGGIKGLGGGDDHGGGIQIGEDLNDGFSETLAAGINVSRDFTPKTWIRSSYFLSSLDNQQDRLVQQQQLLGSDVSSFSDLASTQGSDNLTHQVNVNAQATFAEGHDMRLRANFSASNSTLLSDSFQDTKDADLNTQNTAATLFDTEADHLGGNAQLTWRKRLSENGRSIVALASLNLNDSDQLSDLESTTGFLNKLGVLTYDEILQEQRRFGKTLRHTERLSLTEPLGKVGVLELFGEHKSIQEDETARFFDISNLTPIFNDSLSSGFEKTYTYLKGGLRFARNRENFWITVGLNVQRSDLDGSVLGEDVSYFMCHNRCEAGF